MTAHIILFMFNNRLPYYAPTSFQGKFYENILNGHYSQFWKF